MAKVLNEQKHQTQRMCLLSHARRLFATHGVKETSMSQVAKACRVTKATLYHYFKGKETILKDILACRTTEIDNLSEESDPRLGLEESFYQFGKAHLEHLKKPENLELMKILLSETLKNSEMRKYYMSFVQEVVAKGAQQVLARHWKGKKPEKEMRLLFFQFLAALLHYEWNTRMVGDLTDLVGNDEVFLRRLSRTYALAVQAG
ncbi:MAG TPA: helix-turn-helix domain-containing protein [bacterium]|nr:helix-turn-helix domain-containing protein [bacterium]